MAVPGVKLLGPEFAVDPVVTLPVDLIPLTVEVRLFICCESPSDMATECADDIWCDEADILCREDDF